MAGVVLSRATASGGAWDDEGSASSASSEWALPLESAMPRLEVLGASVLGAVSSSSTLEARLAVAGDASTTSAVMGCSEPIERTR